MRNPKRGETALTLRWGFSARPRALPRPLPRFRHAPRNGSGGAAQRQSLKAVVLVRWSASVSLRPPPRRGLGSLPACSCRGRLPGLGVGLRVLGSCLRAACREAVLGPASNRPAASSLCRCRRSGPLGCGSPRLYAPRSSAGSARLWPEAAPARHLHASSVCSVRGVALSAALFTDARRTSKAAYRRARRF